MLYYPFHRMSSRFTAEGENAGKRLRNDAKQCKIVLLRYTKALDNDNVIKCN